MKKEKTEKKRASIVSFCKIYLAPGVHLSSLDAAILQNQKFETSPSLNWKRLRHKEFYDLFHFSKVSIARIDPRSEL